MRIVYDAYADDLFDNLGVNKMKPLLITLPNFHGFYESIHSDKIDQAENAVVQDENGDVIEGLESIVWENLDYRAVHTGYAKLYCDNFAALHKIPLRFASLDSPREYNFTTDKIRAYISLATVKRLFDSVPPMTLANEIKAKFTNYDGFAIFYSNDLQANEWQVPLDEWDHNMLSTLLSAYLNQEHSEVDLNEQELYMVDDYNSAISNLVWDNLSQEIKDKISMATRRHYEKQLHIFSICCGLSSMGTSCITRIF